MTLTGIICILLAPPINVVGSSKNNFLPESASLRRRANPLEVFYRHKYKSSPKRILFHYPPKKFGPLFEILDFNSM